MLYRIQNGSLSLGGEQILSHINFEIKGTEKVAITGKNGAGKTSLLRLILGELETDRDDKQQEPVIYTARHFSAAMLRQTCRDDEMEQATIEEICLMACPTSDLYSRERYLYEMEFDRMFTGLGFSMEDKNKKFGHFSGGQQTKISLIRHLLQKPDLLLLDEPTNHLDIAAVEWLEGYLKSYEKAVIIVSHDRFFLDQVVNVVYDLDQGHLKRYAGNYSDFRRQQKKEREIQQKAWEQQQAEIQRLNQLIEKFKHKPTKASFARSRKSMLQRMEKIEKPAETDAHFFSEPLEPLVKGSKWVFEAEHLKVGYEKTLFELSLRVKRGQKIGILGENGSGKTTFLKTAAGMLEPLEGKCALGNGILMGCFDQQSAAIEDSRSVIEHFHSLYPAMTEKDARQTLGAYLFGGRDASKRVSDLSGGEKARLILCEILAGRPNLLILDEPTNHMDIDARETLESAFQAYKGTMLFVSHDRYFLREVADALLILRDGAAFYYPFGYEHYLRHCRDAEAEDLSALIQAENQALIADLRAVPKAEKHRLREIDTETAYAEWRMDQETQKLEKCRQEYEDALLIYNEELWEEKENDFTYMCLEWYNLYLDMN